MVLTGLTGLVTLAPAAPAGAYPATTVSLTGHGFGSGQGMGQWGALGDALAGLSADQILTTYYGTLSAGGQTTIGALPNGWNDLNTSVTVALTANAGNDVIVTSNSAPSSTLCSRITRRPPRLTFRAQPSNGATTGPPAFAATPIPRKLTRALIS